MKKTFKVFLVLADFLLTSYISLYAIAYLIPPLELNNINGIYYYDSDGNLFTGTTKEWINIDNISTSLIDATIAAEDKKFYKHLGFDYLRILKATWTNIKNKQMISGASTISQQYVKNLFLSFDKNFSRKIKEAWLTIRLETHYSKDQILEGYLNTINYGNVFGIENASKYYFNKSAKDLNLAEASMIAGIPKWPTGYSPVNNYENAKKRQKEILSMMVKNKIITEKEMQEAYNQELKIVANSNTSHLKTLMYYQDAVLDELKSIPGINLNESLKVYTNLNLDLQRNLEENINKNMENIDEAQIASIIIEPKTGKILALTGGKNFYKSEFNRATDAKRAVGSTIKPFLYYQALKSGFTPSTTFTSEKTTFVFSENQTYSPHNYANLYAEDDITLASAIVLSDNIYAIKTHLFLGEDKLVNIAKDLNISNNLKQIPSLALGSQEISLLSMMNGYQVLANNGVQNETYFIDHIEDKNGNLVYVHKNKSEQKLDSDLVYILNSMLSNCASTSFISYSYPTCTSLIPKLTHKYAIKTGSTDSDCLIFGYTEDILMGVWTGYDDNRNTTSKESLASKNVWADTIEAFYKDKEAKWYVQPKNVVGSLIDTKTGKLATNESAKKAILYYLKGTEPK